MDLLWSIAVAAVIVPVVIVISFLIAQIIGDLLDTPESDE